MSVKRRLGDWIDNRYEVFDIHTGGMGVVYIVYDHRGESGRRVLALKTLRDEFLLDNRQITRFVTECETWIKLERHPHVVRAYSVQMIEDKPYAVLELVTGGDLRRWIGSSRLDLPQILRFGIQFCLAMEHAVQKGLHCHRDIKPENLLITEGGMLKVTDFGLAKVRDEAALTSLASTDPIPLAEGQDDDEDDELPEIPIEGGGWDGPGIQIDGEAPSEDDEAFLAALDLEVPQPGGPTVDFQTPDSDSAWKGDSATVDWKPSGSLSDRDDLIGDGLLAGPTMDVGPRQQTPAPRNVTRDGAILGTGSYMAPEQFRNAKAVNHLADLYSFGIVLFEMITTKPPFRGETFKKLERQHAKALPPSLVPYLAGRYSKVARAVDKVVKRCLEKDPSKRFASFRELREALSKVLWWVAAETVAAPTETEMDAWDLTSRGVSLGTLGRLDEERESYEESIRVKPDYVPAWFNQAATLGALGRLVEAMEYADMALHLNPRSVPALINKGLALHSLHRPDEAIVCFDTASHIQPRDPDVWSSRILVLLGQGNTEGALMAQKQLKRLRPEKGEGASPFAAPHSADPAGLQSINWIRRTEDTPIEIPSK